MDPTEEKLELLKDTLIELDIRLQARINALGIIVTALIPAEDRSRVLREMKRLEGEEEFRLRGKILGE